MTLACALAGCASEPSGGRPWLHNIVFEGNAHVPKRDLTERIALEETSFLPLAPRKYFDPLTLEIDRERIETWYHAHGFFLARVVSMRVLPRDGESVDVAVKIDEGPRATVSAVELHGLDALPEKERLAVTRDLPLRQGVPFVHQEYLDERNLVLARLRAGGRAWATVKGEALVDRDAATVVIRIEATPGVEVRFGKVYVRGSTLTTQVERRSAIHEGDRFDPDALDATQSRLAAAGPFAAVRVTPTPRPGDPTIADVLVDVTPGARNDFRIGIGFGLEGDRQLVQIPVRYTRFGFLGGLRRLEVRGRAGYMALPTLWSPTRSGPVADVDVTLLQPDFLARNLLLRANAGYDLGVDYAFKYHGPRGAVGVDYLVANDRVQLSGSLNAQYLRFYSLTAPDVFENPLTARAFLGYTNPYPLLYVLEQVIWDHRDRPFDPRLGFYLWLTFEEGIPIGNGFLYQKLSPDVRGYVPLGSHVVVSGRLVYGHIFNEGSTASPITRRFYLGGSDSHRGFNYDRLSPQVVASDGTRIPVGGDSEFLAQLEVRTDVVRLGGNWLGLAAFVDAGDVPPIGSRLDLGQLNYAVGGGLRYRTVIGVIRFDMGVRLNRLSDFQPDGRPNPDPGQRFAFHLGIGEPF